MGLICTLALPLLLLCWEAGDSRGFTGSSRSGPCPITTTNTVNVLTAVPGISTSSQGAFPTPGLAKTTEPGHFSVAAATLGTETFSKTLTPAATASETGTKETLTISPASETQGAQIAFPVTGTMNTKTAFSTTESRDTQTMSPASEKTIPLATGFRDAQTTVHAAETRDTQTISPTSDTKTLRKIIPSDLMAAITIPVRALSTSGSFTRTGQATDEIPPGNDPMKATSDSLCTDDSSEETKCITNNALPLVRTSVEAESPSSDSSSSSVSSAAVITASQDLGPDVATSSKASVPRSTPHIKFLGETETAAAISGTSDAGRSPTGVSALSISETSALSASTEAKSPILSHTFPAETLSTVSTSESAAPNTTPDAPRPSSSTGTKAVSSPTSGPRRAQVTVSMGRLGETSALSQQSYTVVSGAVIVSAKAASTVCEGTSSAGSSASVSVSSERAIIKNSTPSGPFTADSTSVRDSPTGRGRVPSVHPATASSSQEPVVTSAMTTTAPKPASEVFTTDGTTSRAFSTSGTSLSSVPSTTANSSQETNITSATVSPKTLRATSSATSTSQTPEVIAGADGDFLLLRLKVASLEDLTEPTRAERLVQQGLSAEVPDPIPSSLRK
ncbi:PREDICTED: mucin-20 isoform X2 [Chinchilla lanigera]|uniref:mucin-20 isoform X2 n=1 Tax=Chinchilla lanigera TaxID=34839 RepID=UPI0006981826|nr:PREDICTED: mucin-20 isoform X2 [Chinchilla lanigera]